MESKDRQEAIREKGFSMNGNSTTEYGKIKVGIKTLEDAIIELGCYRRLWDRGPIRFYDKVEILKAIAERDYRKLRIISDFFYRTNGIYQRIVNYYATMYRWDWYTVPTIFDDRILENEEKGKKVINEFFKALNYLDNTHIKKVCGDITLKIIIIILNRDISRILLHISTTFIANGIGLIIMKVLVDKYLSALVTDHFVNGIIGKLNSNLTRLSLLCLLIGFVFLIAFFLYKILYRRKEKPQLVEMTTEALPQYEKPREEKIFFNNNQQPQIPKPEPFIPGKSGRKKHESAMSDDLIDLIVADNKNADIKEEEKK